MRDYEWFVDFDDTGVDPVVRAGTEDEAIILAQAQRIKAGLTWRRIKEVRRSTLPRRRQRCSPLA